MKQLFPLPRRNQTYFFFPLLFPYRVWGTFFLGLMQTKGEIAIILGRKTFSVTHKLLFSPPLVNYLQFGGVRSLKVQILDR